MDARQRVDQQTQEGPPLPTNLLLSPRANFS
jgi:hypothetical protein